MRRHVLLPLFVTAVLLLVAFSTGSAVFLLPAVLLLLVLLFAWVSVRWVVATINLQAASGQRRVYRNEPAELMVRVTHRCPLPVAPIRLCLEDEDALGEGELVVDDAARRSQTLRIPCQTCHVGPARVGVRCCVVEDVFGLFSARVLPGQQPAELLVLPQCFSVQPLQFAPVDAGMGTMARATEDLSSPSDVRGWQPGDAMKKVHWKLSARKRELMVCRYEEPVLPESVVLLDCGLPDVPSVWHPWLRDALLETAASVVKQETEAGHTVRLPLRGRRPMELSGGMGMPLICEWLARAEFSEGERFQQVLALESRRMRLVGAAVVITCGLSGAIVETLCRMRRLGPSLRLYLAAIDPEDPAYLPFIARLQAGGVEVCYVRVEQSNKNGAVYAEKESEETA